MVDFGRRIEGVEALGIVKCCWKRSEFRCRIIFKSRGLEAFWDTGVGF